MNKEEFEEWVVDVHCDLFHVMPTYMDDEHGVRIDQLRVLSAINKHPKVLQHKTLKQLLEQFEVLN